jgi:hypothetical protein
MLGPDAEVGLTRERVRLNVPNSPFRHPLQLFSKIESGYYAPIFPAVGQQSANLVQSPAAVITDCRVGLPARSIAGAIDPETSESLASRKEQKDMLRSFILAVAVIAAAPAAAQWELGIGISRDDTIFSQPASQLQDDVLILGKLILGYRHGPWHLELSSENGDSSQVIVVGFPEGHEIARDRFDLRAAYDIRPWLQIEGGGRRDELRYTEFFAGSNDLVDLRAKELLLAARFRTAPRRVGFFGALELAAGDGDFRGSGTRESVDTTRSMIHLGVPIQLGMSRWTLTPGIRAESLDAGDLTIESTRYYLETRFRFRS